mmetsp:Transcript_49186/g.106978  ORF Transcript_49186/g.106978 Transcript_49186/m.106978 type:complete len:258 (-) Transcript_49186:24-797(-)
MALAASVPLKSGRSPTLQAAQAGQTQLSRCPRPGGVSAASRSQLPAAPWALATAAAGLALTQAPRRSNRSLALAARRDRRDDVRYAHATESEVAMTRRPSDRVVPALKKSGDGQQSSRGGQLAPTVAPYQPGEGYASNAVPFSGVPFRKGALGKAEAEANMERAQWMWEEIESLRQREQIVEEAIPVPVDRVDEVLEALAGCECDFGVQEGEEEAYGFRWSRIAMAGDSSSVRAGALRVMACLAPQPAGAADQGEYR